MIALDNGFDEAVAIVADAAASAARFCAATGFAVRHRGAPCPGALALLGLEPELAAREVLIGHRQSPRGFIRLIDLPGPPAPPGREGAQAWDTGGIFDINLRALAGIEPLHRALADRGFVSPAPVTTWDFGSLLVREVIGIDADGLCIALMERLHPPLTGYEGLRGPASWVFNSTQIVPDFAAARAFYCDTLGWQVVQETDGFAAPDPSGANCMGLPLDLAPRIPMRIGIYHPHGRMEGSVEIIALGVRGHDRTTTVVPPARGWAALRFPVRDVDGFVARGAAAGCATIGPLALDLAPRGPARGGAIITPWGARLEAFSLPGQGRLATSLSSHQRNSSIQ